MEDRFWESIAAWLEGTIFGKLLSFLVGSGMLYAVIEGVKAINKAVANRREKKRQEAEAEARRKKEEAEAEARRKKEEAEAEARRKKEAAEQAQYLARLQDLHPYFTQPQVEDARRLFVETQGQNVPPSRDQEPGRPHAFTTREALIPKFLEQAFARPGEDDRFFLVLADSGMGKTTFMINLYMRYLETTGGKPYAIKLFPMGYPEVFQAVQKLVEQGRDSDTILLLDAFDEDGEAAKGYRKRLDEWVALCKNFREVVITSRTQFFPNEEATAGLLSVPRPDPHKPGYHRFKVMYLSPFSDQDIETYLSKKFPGDDPHNTSRHQLARRIVARSPYLMVRPMLLANIDDLLDAGDRSYQQTHEIYEVLIDKWVTREAGRKGTRAEWFQAELLRFSADLAVGLYQKWRDEERLYISREELREFASTQNIELDEIDMTSRSLLNRDAVGNVKFSHKSILEYFLARRAQEDQAFLQSFRPEGLDVARKFLSEYGFSFDNQGRWIKTPKMVLVQGGSFEMGDVLGDSEGNKEKPVHKVTLSDFYVGQYAVTFEQYDAYCEATGTKKPEDEGWGRDDRPVINVSWEDAQAYCAWLSKETGQVWRLPTEAEWEYAAREGGKKVRFGNGKDVANPSQVNFDARGELKSYLVTGEYRQRTVPVGSFAPNGLGLYNMSGNVWEWCEDDWHESYEGAPGYGPAWMDSPRGSDRVSRGGSWFSIAAGCRVSYRIGSGPTFRYHGFGFRLARSF